LRRAPHILTMPGEEAREGCAEGARARARRILVLWRSLRAVCPFIRDQAA